MIDGDTIYTLGDCAKRKLTHRHKASALWVKDCLHVDSVEPFCRTENAFFEIKGCDGKGSVATSNRRVLAKMDGEFLDEGSEEMMVSRPAALRWAFRRDSHPLHSAAVDLVKAINSLSDYPVLDERDLSELEYQWAEEDVSGAWDEAVDAAIRECTRDLTQVYDETDFKLDDLKDGWIRDAMSSEWWAQEKDNVRFPQMEGDTRLETRIKDTIQRWQEEFEAKTDIDSLDAETCLARIAELAAQKWASPAHIKEAWGQVVEIVLNPRRHL